MAVDLTVDGLVEPLEADGIEAQGSGIGGAKEGREDENEREEAKEGHEEVEKGNRAGES